MNPVRLFMSRTTIRSRLIIISAVLVVFVAGFGFLTREILYRLDVSREQSSLLRQQILSLQVILRGYGELVITENTSTSSKKMAEDGESAFEKEMEKIGSDERFGIYFEREAIQKQWADLKRELGGLRALGKKLSASDDNTIMLLGKVMSHAALLEETLKVAEGKAAENFTTLTKNTHRAIYLQLGMVSLLLVFASWVLVISIVKPIKNLQQTTVGIHKQNDFRMRVQSDFDDEIGKMTGSFNALIDSVQTIVLGFRERATRLRNAAQNIRDSASQVNEGSLGQLDVSLVVIDALEKLDEQTTAILNAASSAVQSSREVLTHSTRVEQENIALVSRIDENAERVCNLESRMQALVEKIKRVDAVVDEIDSIAFQTNILSLNAAVESAHAGKVGAGFRIVADAVRNLAGRTKTATEEISKATSGIHSEVVVVSKASQEIAATIRQLSLDAQSSNQGIRGNVSKANQTLGEMESMKQACAIQKTINSDMKSHIQQFLDGSKRNVFFAETLRKSCEDLRLIQDDLEESVSHYRVE